MGCNIVILVFWLRRKIPLSFSLQWDDQKYTTPIKTWKLFLCYQWQNIQHQNHLGHLQRFEAGLSTIMSHNLHLDLQEIKAPFPSFDVLSEKLTR